MTEPRGVEGVSHISVQVRDIERSLRFYRDLLGMAVSVDDVVDSQRERDGEQVEVQRRVVFLRWEDRPGATFILLSQYLNFEIVGEPAQLGEMGVDHFAVIVDDVEGILARANEMGEEVLYGPHHVVGRDYGHPDGGNIMTAVLRDPDGTVVQIDRWY